MNLAVLDTGKQNGSLAQPKGISKSRRYDNSPVRAQPDLGRFRELERSDRIRCRFRRPGLILNEHVPDMLIANFQGIGDFRSRPPDAMERPNFIGGSLQTSRYPPHLFRWSRHRPSCMRSYEQCSFVIIICSCQLILFMPSLPRLPTSFSRTARARSACGG